MNVSELFQSLAYGELSNLALADPVAGAIADASQPRIIGYANEALIRLYARFPLKEADVLVQMHESITNYHLIPKFALNFVPTGSEIDEPVRYILDLPREPFTGDVIRIVSVFDDHGHELPVNDSGNDLSVFTPQPYVVQVPRPQHESCISVRYQAKHPKLSGDLEERIELPDVLYGAFQAYIGYKAYGHMNTQESMAVSQTYFKLYDGICNEVLLNDTANTSEMASTNTRFHAQGWV